MHTPPVIFHTDRTDYRTLTVEQLPRRASLLPCASCGTPRLRHSSKGANACPDFTRPGLPAGHAYIDTVAVGSSVTLSTPTGPVLEQVTQVRTTHPSAPTPAAYLSGTGSRPSVALDVSTTTRRLTGDTIVAL